MGARVTRPFESVVRDCSSTVASFVVDDDAEPLTLLAGERDEARLIEAEEDWGAGTGGGRGPERGEC